MKYHLTCTKKSFTKSLCSALIEDDIHFTFEKYDAMHYVVSSDNSHAEKHMRAVSEASRFAIFFIDGVLQ